MVEDATRKDDPCIITCGHFGKQETGGRISNSESLLQAGNTEVMFPLIQGEANRYFCRWPMGHFTGPLRITE